MVTTTLVALPSCSRIDRTPGARRGSHDSHELQSHDKRSRHRLFLTSAGATTTFVRCLQLLFVKTKPAHFRSDRPDLAAVRTLDRHAGETLDFGHQLFIETDFRALLRGQLRNRTNQAPHRGLFRAVCCAVRRSRFVDDFFFGRRRPEP